MAKLARRPVRVLAWLDFHNQSEPLESVVMLMGLLGATGCAIGLSVFSWFGWGTVASAAWVGLVSSCVWLKLVGMTWFHTC